MTDPADTSPASKPTRAQWLTVAKRFVDRAAAIAEAYAERAPGFVGLEGVGVSVGAVTAARAARVLGGATSWGDRFVDGVGRPTPFGETHAHASDEKSWVDHDAPSALAVAVMAAIAQGHRARIEIGPRSRRTRALVEAALEPLAAHFELEDRDAGTSGPALRVEGASRAFVSGGLALGRQPTVLFVAPYYYDVRDLARVVESAALEIVAPALPTNEVVILAPRGWDQADLFEERLRARIDTCPAEERLPMSIRRLEAMGPSDALEAAVESVRALKPTSLGAFIHPLWREREAVVRALATLERESGAHAIALHHGPSLAWKLGSAWIARGTRIRVEAPVAVAPQPSRWRARARLRHESSPGLLGGLGQGALARLGL